MQPDLTMIVSLLPDLISTGLAESDIIFGGEEALKRTLDAVARAAYRRSFCAFHLHC